jgi:hypothetical protein
MRNDLRLRLLAREVELKTYFGKMIAEDLEEIRGDPNALDEQLALLTALVSTASKASRLLWRYGQRATDRIGQREADTLREMLRLDDRSPLAPERITRWTPVLRMAPLDLAEAWNPADGTVSIDGAEYSVRSLQESFRELHHAVEALEDRSGWREQPAEH